MAYKLTEISEKDRELILTQSDGVSWLHGSLVSANKQNKFPRFIAKDADTGSYLMTMPRLVRADPGTTDFLLYWSGEFFKLMLQGWTNEVVVERSSLMNAKCAEDFKSSVVEAFSVYGRFGTGINATDGNPNFRVIPEIIMG